MGFRTINKTFYHAQTVESTTWSVTHGLNTTAPCVDCWVDVDGTLAKIIPLNVNVVSPNAVEITFSTARVGHITIV